MRGKNFAYLWATALFLLVSVTDSIFALPSEDSESESLESASQQLCKTDTGMPSGVSSGQERASGSIPVITESKTWKNLVCSFSGN